MKQLKIILGLILLASVSTFAQSPRIKLNQITKDTVKGSVLISNPSDSGMVYSRDFYIAYGADTVLILYGDTLAATSGIISSVLSDGVTITGDGTTGNELKVDTSTVISTIQGFLDTLTNRNYLTTNETITLSGDVTGSGTTAITATVVDYSHNHIISNVDFLQDSLDAKANDSELSNYLLTSNYIVDSTRLNTTGDTAFYYQNGTEIGSQAIAGGGGTTFNNISEDGDTVLISDHLKVNTNTLYVNADSNRVGIGTSSPTAELTVAGKLLVNGSYISPKTNMSLGEWTGIPVPTQIGTHSTITGDLFVGNVGSNVGRLRLASNDSRGIIIYNGYYNDTLNGSYVMDVNNSHWNIDIYAENPSIGGDYFNIGRSYTGTSSVSLSNLFRILGNGNVGIGTTSPSEKLDVDGNGRFRSIGSGASAGALHYTSTGVLTTNTSDARLKTNLQPLDNTLNKLLGINTYTFNWINETDRIDLGMIAQEVEQIFPNLVFTNNVDGYKGIHYDKFSSILTKAIQEQQAIIETQQSEIDQLKTLITDLTNRLTILENK